MNGIKENILAILAYFDLFKYPLGGAEIYLFLPQKADKEDVDLALKYLVAAQAVYQFGNFYSLQNDYQLAAHRYSSNKKATELIKLAAYVSEMLIKVPYLRGIAVLNPILNNTVGHEQSDIKLFIITAKNRLWVARTLISLLKKSGLIANGFRLEHFIDEERLEIKEQSIYTAVELHTLTPLQGDTIIEQFYTANNWTRQFLPNKVMRLSLAKPFRLSCFKAIAESLFNGKAGEAIDNWLMRLTVINLRRKITADSAFGMVADKHYVMPDLQNFQSTLSARYESKLAQMHAAPNPAGQVI